MLVLAHLDRLREEEPAEQQPTQVDELRLRHLREQESDYKPVQIGYVAFGESARKPGGAGTIRTPGIREAKEGSPSSAL